MPPNRFESEVESFLEGSHGDRTHIKRADHPRLHHYAGRYCNAYPSSAIPLSNKLNHGKGNSLNSACNSTTAHPHRTLESAEFQQSDFKP